MEQTPGMGEGTAGPAGVNDVVARSIRTRWAQDSPAGPQTCRPSAQRGYYPVRDVDPARPVHEDPGGIIKLFDPSAVSAQDCKARPRHIVHPHNLAGFGNVDLAGARGKRWSGPAHTAPTYQKRPQHHNQNTKNAMHSFCLPRNIHLGSRRPAASGGSGSRGGEGGAGPGSAMYVSGILITTIVVLLLWSGVKIVREHQRLVVFRLGRIGSFPVLSST